MSRNILDLIESVPARLAALVALAILAPLMAAIAIAIAVTGQNPIFVQKRVGRGERLVPIFKFRTFWSAQDALFGGDAPTGLRRRLFRSISRLLRETGLDELPQFVNVLSGDMALIGPRPLVPADYDSLPPQRRIRSTVRPGITGLAQVNGGQALDPVSKLMFDIYFIENDSLALRLRVVGRTIARLSGFGGVVRTVDSRLHDLARQHATRAFGDGFLSPT